MGIRYLIQLIYYTDKAKFGFKMLQKMGWSEGKGLGRNEDGAREHVKVLKKDDNRGEINDTLLTLSV